MSQPCVSSGSYSVYNASQFIFPWLLLFAWRCGVSPQTCASHYSAKKSWDPLQISGACSLHRSSTLDSAPQTLAASAFLNAVLWLLSSNGLPYSAPWSRKYTKVRGQNYGRAHLTWFSSLRNHNPEMPDVQCLKIPIWNILCGFLAVYTWWTSCAPVTPLPPETVVLKFNFMLFHKSSAPANFKLFFIYELMFFRVFSPYVSS